MRQTRKCETFGPVLLKGLVLKINREAQSDPAKEQAKAQKTTTLEFLCLPSWPGKEKRASYHSPEQKHN